MAMTLSRPHPERPHEQPGVKLGDEQFAERERWEEAGLLALVGIGVEPGLSDVFARYAADQLFSEIDEVGVRDGANLEVDGYDFAPTFSIWTTIEECLNPPLVWERERGCFTTPPFSEPEVFEFPGGIGPVECVNVEHEEVVLIPRWVDCRRVTFKYGLGEEFIDVLQDAAQARPRPHGAGRRARHARRPARRRRGARCPTRPAGRPHDGPHLRGDARDRARAATARRARSTCTTSPTTSGRWREDGAQAVVWQTAINPVVALELLAEGTWSGAGVLGPEAFDAAPFLALLADYGSPHGFEERDPAAPLRAP